MTTHSQPKIALVYDHVFTQYGGAELVLHSLHTAFPEAPLFTTVVNQQKAPWSKDFVVIPSFLQKFQVIFSQRELLDLVTPITLEQFDFSSYDIVISITSSAAKGILTLPTQLHLCYLLTPTRYLYQDTEQLTRQHPVLSLPIIRTFTRWFLTYLRWWDQSASARPDKIITLSKVVSKRCETYYKRTPDALIYPPVLLPERSTVPTETLPKFPFFLCVSRLMPYKRLDLAIQACMNQQQKLVIAGTGREKANLQKLAGDLAYIRPVEESISLALENAQSENKQIIFLDACTEVEKQELLNNCSAVLMPGIEDFGIIAIEANAFGKPIILSQQSGAAEVITDSETGIYVTEQTVFAVEAALKKFTKTHFSREKLIKNADKYSQEQFVRKFHNLVYQFYREHSTISV